MTNNLMVEPLSLQQVQQRHKLLRDLLIQFSNPVVFEDCFGEMMEKLEAIYSDGYRHMYSEIESITVKMDQSQRDSVSQNLEALRNLMIVKWGEYPDYLYGHILKLSDHVSLEIQRGVEADNRDKESQKMWTQLQESLEESRTEIKKLKTENITTLAIFASVVVGVTGGLTILNNSVNILADMTISQQLFILSLTSFITFNIVFIMMVYVRGMVDDLHERQPVIVSIKRNLPIYVTDFILVIFILLGYFEALS